MIMILSAGVEQDHNSRAHHDRWEPERGERAEASLATRSSGTWVCTEGEEEEERGAQCIMGVPPSSLSLWQHRYGPAQARTLNFIEKERFEPPLKCREGVCLLNRDWKMAARWAKALVDPTWTWTSMLVEWFSGLFHAVPALNMMLWCGRAWQIFYYEVKSSSDA